VRVVRGSPRPRLVLDELDGNERKDAKATQGREEVSAPSAPLRLCVLPLLPSPGWARRPVGELQKLEVLRVTLL
jgi:hypothetical protein